MDLRRRWLDPLRQGACDVYSASFGDEEYRLREAVIHEWAYIPQGRPPFRRCSDTGERATLLLLPRNQREAEGICDKEKDGAVMIKDKEGGLSPSEPIENSGEFTTGSFTSAPTGVGRAGKEKQIIRDLLVEFDEMGFIPTSTVPNPEAYAIKWRDEITKTLEDYFKQSEWISVDERLPKDCVRVLVYGETDIFIATRLNGGWFAPVHCDGEITHWMPLPEPPKGGAE